MLMGLLVFPVMNRNFPADKHGLPPRMSAENSAGYIAPL